MRITTVLPAALILLGAAGPAVASSCSEQIATIERRLDSAGAEQVTGKEPPGGPTSSHSDKALDHAPKGKPTDPSTTASAGGISEARDLIKKARAQDKAGDMKGCEDTMTEAKKKAGALP
ncbi:hypothetical protein ASG51_13495 [Methylobacterium sp. Leaf465]|jgi:hypothetical protein|uniref:hypothetical protein n=1 Tax=unclassified Methylobacterium TaxID=2615210 RepID=UPI0006FE5BA8|nr:MULTISPECIES: hypothetical protein [unclassified Methylobacterium]KQO74906.1 hypothetical protein ASF18_16325 [Methylobacterium sp. Leaf89]KQT70485.1 hypothetical protein ASG51_13495 [Methylobacterium sp. Leaf465]KQU19127.1 hypothetical protein ASG63_08310 [Methylobacterium sp. Leaf94]